ncbi:MAG: radical SAM protein [Bryobacteraceae bacterium]|jgi:DNA repair photolyase
MPATLAERAHRAATLERKRRVEYRELPAVHLLNRCSSDRVPFEWTLNPYRGCEFACKYCYARYTHEFMEFHDSLAFERLIFAKTWSEAALRAELRRVHPGQWIALGTATDPYQPAERRYRLTRRILTVFAGLAGYNLGLTTKSDLVACDAELLQRVSGRNNLRVTMTITTADTALARLLEPMAPRPELRFAALRRLARAGVPCGVTVSPVLPGISDAREALEAVAREARRCGASYFQGHVVFLQPSAAAVFLPFLEREFPHLAKAYLDRFSRAAYIRGDYPQRIQDLIGEVRAAHGLEGGACWQPMVEQASFDFGAPSAAAPLRLLPVCR